MTDTPPTTQAPPPAEEASRRRSPRELLFEVTIVFIGMVMALSAQQAVDWLHWRAEVADTRQALDAELTQALATIQEQDRQTACENALLDAFDAWARGESTGVPRDLGGKGLMILQTSAFEVAKTGQGAAHIPLKARLDYARVYNSIDEVNSVTIYARDATRQLMGFVGKTDLTADERRRLGENVNQMRAMRGVWKINTLPVVAEAGRLGVRPPPPAAPLNVAKDCRLPTVPTPR